VINQDTQEARDTNGLFSFKSAKYLWDQTLNLIFPPLCQHCGRVDTSFCDTCSQDLLSIPVELITTELPPLQQIVSSGRHVGLLQAAVQSLKYNNQQQLGSTLALRLENVLKHTNWQFDTIIPVPLHTQRLQKRGYNQAKEISIHLAQLMAITHHDEWLIRHSQTQSQVGLTRDERLENVKDAFTVTTDELQGLKVLLLDDVRTTGATMAACAEVLMQAGVQSVYGITITAAQDTNQ